MTSRIGVSRISRQKGVVLIVGLIMVLLISIVALASIKGSGLQEAMSGNMRDRGLAFQVAEGGLADGENVIETRALFCNGIVSAGIRCWRDRDQTPVNSVQYFSAADFTTFGNVSGLNLGQNIPPAEFVIEELLPFQAGASNSDLTRGGGFDVNSYRVTALGGGISSDSQAILQSTFTTPR